MDIENWDQVRMNIEKAVKQGQRIPVCFWSGWSLVYVVFKAVQTVKDLAFEVRAPLKKLQVSEEMQTEIEKDNSQLVEKPVKVTQKDNGVTKERTNKLKKKKTAGKIVNYRQR